MGLIGLILRLATAGVLDKLLAYFQNKTDKDAMVNVEHVKAEIERRKVQQEIITVEQGWWVTAMIRPMIIYPFVLHIWAITLDTVFKFGWAVPALPGPFNDLEFAVVLSYFITRPIEKGVRSFLSK